MYLNTHTYFSFKYGTLSVANLLSEAQRYGIRKLVLTDINNTSACLDFIRLAPAYNIEPVVGIDFRKGVDLYFIAIAKNNQGFFEINSFLSQVLSGQIELQKQAPVFRHAFVIYPFTRHKTKKLNRHEFVGVRISELNQLMFSDWKEEPQKLVALVSLTFRHKKDFNAHRLLRAIDNNILLSKLPLSEQAVGNEFFLSEPDLQKAYTNFPLLLLNAAKILDECEIYFEFGKSKNKISYSGNVQSDFDLLRDLCYEGLQYRYGNASQEIIDRLEHELKLIRAMEFCSYFLINWDIVNYAQRKNYFYVGRGSGANSLAAYCLKITDVDPVDLDLYFERFINPSRVNPPDFDLDFSWKDRDDITSYIFQKYGHDRTALLATYSTFQRKSVIRELGKVFGLPTNEIDELVEDKKRKNSTDSITELVRKYSDHIHEFPSHLSVHAGGILISELPMCSYTAITIPPKGFPLTQFSMIEAADIGLHKFDILSQRGLGHIKDTVMIVEKNRGVKIDIRAIAKFKEDEKIKERLRSGKTIGCFYVESPAMRMLLKKLEADTYLGLVAASSIIRPGVAKSGMMREYILRFRHPERRLHIHPLMGELMAETYGVMVYQEDVIKVAHYFAGLSLSEADVMRRGMSGKFRSREEFQKVKNCFFENCKQRGYEDSITTEVWRQIESFAGYSFSKGHSASYAVESYQSLYLKAYYPKEFMVGVINNFGGFYRTELYIHEARMSGANVVAPCINKSEYVTTIEGDEIYLGFVHLGELQTQTAELILEERNRNGIFLGLADFLNRVSISLEQLRIFIRIGAFRFTGKGKKELLWEVHVLLGAQKKSIPVKELFAIERKDYVLPDLYHHLYDDALDEIEILGFPLCSPFLLLKEKPISNCRAKTLSSFHHKTISITGYLITRKTIPTSRGDLMCFGTFIDEEGDFFDTVHFSQALEAYPFRGNGCYSVYGKVVEEFGFYSLEVIKMEKLSTLDRDL